MTLIDSNIFFRIFAGDRALAAAVRNLNPIITTIVYLELIQGQKSNQQVKTIETFLSQFPIVHFDKQIAFESINLIRLYSKSHGLMLTPVLGWKFGFKVVLKMYRMQM